MDKHTGVKRHICTCGKKVRYYYYVQRRCYLVQTRHDLFSTTSKIKLACPFPDSVYFHLIMKYFRTHKCYYFWQHFLCQKRLDKCFHVYICVFSLHKQRQSTDDNIDVAGAIFSHNRTGEVWAHLGRCTCKYNVIFISLQVQ